MKTAGKNSFLKKSLRPFLLMAGPCSIENEEQIQQITKLLKEEDVFVLRGGIFKLRTHPHSFQGLGTQALPLIQNLKQTQDLQFISEITDPRQMESLFPVVDIFQVGARNMYNYELLKELGTQTKPVLLKRSFCAPVKEWLLAAEYLIQGGNEQIILCERGIRTFETGTRNTLDLSGALLAQKKSSLPVIVDPSHATGDSSLVIPTALAAAAAGIDGLLVEVHPEPKKALSDGAQSLNFLQFKEMMKQLRKILSIMEKKAGKGYEDLFYEKTAAENKTNIQLHSS